MTDLALDTHALLWYLQGSARLSPAGAARMNDARRAGGRWHVSAISLAEILYMEERGRAAEGTCQQIKDVLATPDSYLVVVPVTRAIAEGLGELSYKAVPDLHDRIIGVTALHLGLDLVTADAELRAAPGLRTVW